MQLNTCTANKLSQLCVRVSTAEKKAGIPLNLLPVNRPRGLSNNPSDKLNKLCQRINKLEKVVGIQSVETKQPYRPLGPNGNAVLSNKVNKMCSRIARVEKLL